MAEIYLNAARIVEKILSKKGTPKNLVLENNTIKNKKKLYALVCEAIKFKPITDELLESTGLLFLEKKLKYSMALVLVYDFLFGRGLQVGGQLKQVIKRNKNNLQVQLARMKVKAKVVNNEDLLPQNIHRQQETLVPRYVRVNTLKTCNDDIISWFTQHGFKVNESDDISSTKMFKQDEHIPNILVFPPETDLHDNPLYINGDIILQDKASCFPAFVLSPPPGSHVIDACSAPGNKTSHLAALMCNKGKIFAFDISAKRITTMKTLLERAGESIVTVKEQDFLKTEVHDPMYTNVHYILVDPSCSGSGIINRLDYATGTQDKMEDEERVSLLALFQAKVLSHALRFPNVKKVVYSTCSLYDMENEDVVAKVLEKHKGAFGLEPILLRWPHRGRTSFPEAWKCVRASPSQGLTSGFFLASFVRKTSIQPFVDKDEEMCQNSETRETRSREHKRTSIQVENVCSSVKPFHVKTKRSVSLVPNVPRTKNLRSKNTKEKNSNILRKKQGTRLSIKTRKWQTIVRTEYRKCSPQEFEEKLSKIAKKMGKSKE